MPSDRTSLDGTLSEIIKVGELVAEKYRIERVIGVGGMGVVVQAFHLHFEERVAIKFLHPELVESDEARARFEREARAAFKIKSEHVARVIDVGTLRQSRVPYMVMEYLAGTDMADVLAARCRLPIEDAVDFIMQTSEAVGEAHTLGIVHRDLKPENLFLTHRADGTPCIKVLDFGLSKLHVGTVPRRRERTLTSTKQPMGTPQYMSPEQWMSAKDVGPATDIWALGVMLYEFCTGAQPFHKEQLPQLCTMVLQGEPKPMQSLRDGIPDHLDRVVRRCLQKDPSQRYANIAEMALDLHHVTPQRVRASARRIAGVFRRVGVELAQEPPPPSVNAPLGIRSFRDTEYDSETRVMAGRPDASTLVMPEETPLPYGPAALRAPPAAASTSGNYPAVPPGHAGESGRYDAASIQDRASASGEYRAQAHGEPSTPGLEGSSDRHRRAVTAQSWQHMLLEPPQRSRGKRALVVVAVTAAVCTLLAAVAVVSTGALQTPSATSAAPPAAGPSSGEPSLGEPSPGGSTTVADAESATPPASASPQPSASAPPTARPAPLTPRPRTIPRPARRRAPPPPPVVESAPEPKSIFDER